jgi:ubiquinone/menaquinone biosynthesis C-methylase UbiE
LVKTVQRAGWQYYDEHVDSCDVVRGRALDTLEADDRIVAEWFIDALRGCRRVLDVGCGSGYPGLYLADHVGELVGIDAAPNMIRAAQESCARLQVPNARFEVQNAAQLSFRDASFDGAMVCGALECMDWEAARLALEQIRRVLKKGGRLAVLDQDWELILQHKPHRRAWIRQSGERLLLRVLERTRSPPTERDERYLVAYEGPTGQRLLAALGDKRQVRTGLSGKDLAPEDILELVYEETAQFDRQTLAAFASSAGFRDVQVERLDVWSPGVLVLTATK